MEDMRDDAAMMSKESDDAASNDYHSNNNNLKVSELEAIDDICKGTVYASLAITDNKKRTLRKISKANPWHEQALKMITGGDTRMAHSSLEKLLDSTMGLTLDKLIDVQGVTPGGHFLDTQGYIAHDDKQIILSYRCTTSAFDWLTNFNTTSSAWEVKEDAEQGFSGFCSGFSGLCCHPDGYRPRVHTGFYNNFLCSIPHIREYIDPLLRPDQPPRKLYVVGHSLGAGIATLAGCYFALEYDWNELPHTLINVTAGSPRACCTSMKDLMEERLKMLSPLKCRLYRVRCGKDVVCNVPPKSLGFRHLVDSTKLEDGQIYWDKASRASNSPAAQSAMDAEENEPRMEAHDDLSSLMAVAEDVHRSDNKDDPDERYQRFVAKIPLSLRHHMPDAYLTPLMAARGVRHGQDLCMPPLIMERTDGRRMYRTMGGDDDSDDANNNNNKNKDVANMDDYNFTETESEVSDKRPSFRRGLLKTFSPKKSQKEGSRSWLSLFGRSGNKKSNVGSPEMLIADHAMA